MRPIYIHSPSRMKKRPVAVSFMRGPGGGPERWVCFDDLRFGGLDDVTIEGFGGRNIL